MSRQRILILVTILHLFVWLGLNVVLEALSSSAFSTGIPVGSGYRALDHINTVASFPLIWPLLPKLGGISRHFGYAPFLLNSILWGWIAAFVVDHSRRRTS